MKHRGISILSFGVHVERPFPERILVERR